MNARWIGLGMLVLIAGCGPPGPPASDAPRAAIDRPVVTLGIGQALRLHIGRPDSAPPPHSRFGWTSSDSAVATVDSAGVVRGVSYGSVRVAASSPAETTQARVVVAPPVLVGAGDIARCDSPGAAATAALVERTPGVVFTAGDNAYPNGSAENFARCYDPAWGRFRARTLPAVGNHDARSAGAAPYFEYFGPNAGPAGRGYYSYDLGGWHVVVLNSTGDVGRGSAQERWLRADLAAHPARCTLAYWHHPRFSSGPHGNSAKMADLWRTLYDAGADVVISGHDHLYERFAPQTADGRPDPARGIREFVVGTGGASHYAIKQIRPNSEVRDGQTFGVLRLALEADGYAWTFVPVPGGNFRDAGRGRCH